MPNSISCIAAATPDSEGNPGLQDIPAFYMKKLAYPPEVRKAWMADPSIPVSVDAPLADVIQITAKILGKNPRDVVVMILDRPRNEPFIEEVRRAGASLRMIADGDISAALAPASVVPTSICMQESAVRLKGYWPPQPSAVLEAVCRRKSGRGTKLKRKSLIEIGWGDRLNTVYRSKDLARGTDILFAATGISDSPC